MALVLLLTGCGERGSAASQASAPAAHSDATAKPIGEVALFTSLPILWRESDDVAGLLDAAAPHHWALDLADLAKARPVDTLSAQSLGKGGGLLLMAQPRPLSPDENVALDAWVRNGGHVLLFADPMLTAESRFALGDGRRPQDIVMLSPVLRHWGLDLRFDESQPPQERLVTLADGPFPIRLAGHFVAIGENPGCAMEAGGLLAECRLGRGKVLALADADFLGDSDDPEVRAARSARLSELVTRAAR